MDNLIKNAILSEDKAMLNCIELFANLKYEKEKDKNLTELINKMLLNNRILNKFSSTIDINQASMLVDLEDFRNIPPDIIKKISYLLDKRTYLTKSLIKQKEIIEQINAGLYEKIKDDVKESTDKKNIYLYDIDYDMEHVKIILNMKKILKEEHVNKATLNIFYKTLLINKTDDLNIAFFTNIKQLFFNINDILKKNENISLNTLFKSMSFNDIYNKFENSLELFERRLINISK
ncbi:hypothetical protein LbFV_ORF18 [Leptopilina boulardi filamentous virus]|uniref:Uncharacterized protein n=1 Tax=Leptopilina boulardi filamentous virus TaxID=552509 RepID=A0A1S5YD58_9VIRU|nr:hypothetical protein LbFV_ORF18 [Leptopilina boulardi filamentous virus]AQQ79938.1 hypothetical protein LbFV_ORF18 [Leptopilina boulardi filamentous virus]